MTGALGNIREWAYDAPNLPGQVYGHDVKASVVFSMPSVAPMTFGAPVRNAFDGHHTGPRRVSEMVGARVYEGVIHPGLGPGAGEAGGGQGVGWWGIHCGKVGVFMSCPPPGAPWAGRQRWCCRPAVPNGAVSARQPNLRPLGLQCTFSHGSPVICVHRGRAMTARLNWLQGAGCAPRPAGWGCADGTLRGRVVMEGATLDTCSRAATTARPSRKNSPPCLARWGPRPGPPPRHNAQFSLCHPPRDGCTRVRVDFREWIGHREKVSGCHTTCH